MYLKRRNNALRVPALAGAALAGLLMTGQPGSAQDRSPVTFGKVTAGDFAVAALGADTAADAVVISDVGIRSFDKGEGGYTGLRWYGYLQETKRIIILKRRGFEAATVTVPLAENGTRQEEITDLSAATYNLEGGRVVKTELDKKSIFKINVTNQLAAERFTFPALREGSIIEYMYTVRSPFLSSRPWPLQGVYPCLWSEYKVSIPPGFSYSILSQSTLPFCIEKDETTAGVRVLHWAVKDVPAMKVEPFTTTVNNYLAKVDIRISGFEYLAVTNVYDRFSGQYRTNIADVKQGGVLFGLVQMDRVLLQSDHFGADLTADNSWLDEDLSHITAGAGDDAGKAKKIYDYVRDNFACNSNAGFIMSHPIKSVYRARSGSEAELNLLLTAMLNHARLKAVPVLLSTRSNGFVDAANPQPSQLNYVVCKLRIGGASYYLDASDRNLGFGHLPLECYNGYDILVDTAEAFPEVALSADSTTEQKKVVVYLTNGDKEGLDGTVQDFPGIAESEAIRKQMKEQDGAKKLRDQLRSGSTVEETISDLEIDSLQLPDEPLAINYSFHLPADSTAERIYFTPTLVGRMINNPFNDADRLYPVEMPYAKDENYILTMDLPNGYVVDELPKSEKVMLDASGEGGYFEYALSQDGDQIHFRTRIRLMAANYNPQVYPFLRQFYATIIKKEAEQIVFKKKR